MQAWEALKPGDTVYLIAPSFKPDEGNMQAFEEMLQSWGLNVVKPKDINEGYHLWGNTAQRRAEHVVEALHTPGIKAIFCAQDGQGAAEVVAALLQNNEAELINAPNRGIPLFGHSDNTHLHFFLGGNGIVSPVQGVSPKFVVENSDLPEPAKNQIAANREALRNYLFNPESYESGQDTQLLPLNSQARSAEIITGTSTGGSEIVTKLTHRTNYRVDTDAEHSNILMLDGRTSGSLRDVLSLLQEQGKLDTLNAIVLSRYYDNREFTGEITAANTSELERVVEELGITVPVYFGANFGHPTHNASPVTPTPIHTDITITQVEGRISLQAKAVRTQEDLEWHRNKVRSYPHSPQKPRAPDKSSVPTESHTFRTMELEAVQHPEGLSSLAAEEAIGGHIQHDPSYLPDVLPLLDLKLNQRHLVLVMEPHLMSTPEGAILNGHLELSQLHASGQLNHVKSLSIVSSGGIPDEFTAWLKDFAQNNLPDIPVAIGKVEDTKNLPQTFLASIPKTQEKLTDCIVARCIKLNEMLGKSAIKFDCEGDIPSPPMPHGPAPKTKAGMPVQK